MVGQLNMENGEIIDLTKKEWFGLTAEIEFGETEEEVMKVLQNKIDSFEEDGRATFEAKHSIYKK